MKRKLISLLTIGLATSMLFVACGKDGDTPNTEDSSGGQTPNEDNEKGEVADERIKASKPEALPDVAKNRKDTLIVGGSAPNGEFVPIYSGSAYDGVVNDLIFEGLITNDENANPIELVAKEWIVSEDGKTYTFKLNKGIKFTNGDEVTAKDVAFTYTALCDPTYDGPRTSAVDNLVGYEEYNKGDAKEVAGIKVIDNYTIEFTLKEVDATSIWNFAYGIMPESYYGFEKGNFQAVKDKLLQPLGSGPYKFEHFKPGAEVKLSKNEDYWRGEPKIPYIVLKVTNGQTQVQELMAGTIDIDSVPARPENITPLTDAGFINLDLFLDNGYGYIGLNMKNPKLSDVKVRHALIYGLDREGFMQAYYSGYGKPYNSHILPTSWAYNPDVPTYDYDPDKANEILDEAGWIDSNNNGIRDKDGVELDLKWMTHSGSKYVETLIPIVQECWKEIGVNVVPEIMEFATLTDKVDERTFDIYNMAWTLSIDPDPSEIFAISQDTTGGFNYVGWNNEKADKLLQQALTTTDQDERKKLYYEWQLIFSEDLPYINLGSAKKMIASSSRIKNLDVSTYKSWTKDVHLLEFVE